MPENTPQSIAVGIIYFVSQEFKLNIDKRSINNISDISDITITKCYKKLETMKEQLIPQSFRDMYAK
jgi:transcription initiation factor TFIIIB Brf1 subunit/transcription initiation factor TFIIB